MNAQTTITPANDCETNGAPAIGTPASPPGAERVAYVVAVERDTAQTFTIGTGAGMAANRYRITLARADGYVSSPLSEHIAAPMIARARGVAPISEREAAELFETAKRERDANRAQAKLDSDAREVSAQAAADEFARLRPSWAKAAIVAELVEDQSDTMTDYHGSTRTRSVVLAWSRHTRDLFPELRAAAALFPETAELEGAPDSAEHREKYSMGGGYYLKAGWRHSNGWKVAKDSYGGGRVAGLEFSDAARAGFDVKQAAKVGGASAAPARAAMPAGQACGFTISEHVHTKKGFAMWIATAGERVERDVFDAQREAARELGGWYSRPWGKTPGGFAFKDHDSALQFVAEQGGAGEGPGDGDGNGPGKGSSSPAAPRVNPADKLRTLADGMADAVAACFARRDTNTPKRARQAAEKRNDGVELERAQAILRALADAHDAGTVPALLAGVTTKKAALELAKEECDRSGAGYYDAGILTGRPYPWADIGKHDVAERAAAAWALVKAAGAVDRSAELELAQKLEAVRFAKIPGYFPTPTPIVARMIEAAGIEPGQRVLEPSAGSGAIADAVRDAGATVECVETWASLASILTAKGHSVTEGDFLDFAPLSGEAFKPLEGHSFDAVLMNPPFEKAQDVAHVRHAYRFVKRGGVLVAIMGAGVTFRKDRAYAEFREFVDAQGGEIVELPAGAFKESGTGVASVMVTITRD